MQINELTTPAVLLDLDQMEKNIKNAACLAKEKGKLFCPMTKTHKSTEIARMQLEAGAHALLVGTLDEAETFAAFAGRLLLPYPVATPANLARVRALLKRVDVTLALDCLETALLYQACLGDPPAPVPYLLVIDVGLHRIGIAPDQAADVASAVRAQCPALLCAGVATHPGQVYACQNAAETQAIAAAANDALLFAADSLRRAGFPCPIVATGSTPTFLQDVQTDGITMLRPGNYVFYDLGQVVAGAATREQCALTVLAGIIAHPQHDLFIMDCGSKTLALDRGAHGNAAFTGYGEVLSHPNIVVESLSEEVGKLRATGETGLRIGDQIRILPNHACPVANLAGKLIGVRGNEVCRLIDIDARSNAHLCAANSCGSHTHA